MRHVSDGYVLLYAERCHRLRCKCDADCDGSALRDGSPSFAAVHSAVRLRCAAARDSRLITCDAWRLRLRSCAPALLRSCAPALLRSCAPALLRSCASALLRPAPYAPRPVCALMAGSHAPARPPARPRGLRAALFVSEPARVFCTATAHCHCHTHCHRPCLCQAVA
jgi:hypothetical protein